MEKLLQLKKSLVYIMCLVAFNTYAQDTIKKTNSIGKFDEQFMVLKSDKKVKQGSYRLYTEKKLVASGSYDHGKRAGVWNFYNRGALEQQFDYTANKVIMDESDKSVICEIDDSAPGDVVKKAIKVGGYNGVAFLAACAKFDDSDITGESKITHVLSLDVNGKITSWSSSVKNADGIKIIHPDYADVFEDIAKFLPATLNGKNSLSLITVRIEQKGGDKEDFKFGADAPKTHGGSGKKSKTP